MTSDIDKVIVDAVKHHIWNEPSHRDIRPIPKGKTKPLAEEFITRWPQAETDVEDGK